MTKKVVLLVLVLALASTHAQAAYFASSQAVTDCPKECGKDKDNMECPNNLCCSASGLCGLGSAYCGAGCQSGACSSSRRCGWQNNGATCPNNQCCSWDGYCGLGDWFCRNNKCQSGPCHYDIKCGKQLNDTQKLECPNNFCCNKDGRCGLGAKYCNSDAGCQSGACYDDSVTMGARKSCGNKEGGNGKICINKEGCTRP